MRRRKRFISGIIFLVIGFILVIISLDAMHKIAEAQDATRNIESFFTHNPTWNPIIKFFGGKAQEKISSYEGPTLFAMITGIIFMLFGLSRAFILRSKK